jgi:hypothetical protein
VVRRKRPIIISIFAGWLIACSFLGTVVFSLVIPQIETIQNDGSELSMWIVERLGKYGILAIGLSIYLFAFFLGYGLWNLQPWSRKAMFWISAIFVAIYISWAIISFAHQTFGEALGILLCAIIFSLPLYYLNRANIRALFISKSQRPISIATQD